MGTHYYATDSSGSLHIFHTQNGRDIWLKDQPLSQRPRAISRRQADQLAGRRTLARMTRSGHPAHLTIEPRKEQSRK